MTRMRYINDNVHGLIRCTNLETAVIHHAVFSRLHGVYQNSIAYQTWPSNRVQRFEHSLGTMKLSGDMLFASLANADEGVRRDLLVDVQKAASGFLKGIKGDTLQRYFPGKRAAINDERSRWKGDKGDAPRLSSNAALAHHLGGADTDPPLPDFTWRLVPGEVRKEDVAPAYLLMQAVRMAGMAHDIGHPPFSHAVEHALEELADEARRRREEEGAPVGEGASPRHVQEDQFLSAIERAKGRADKLHEGMGLQLLDLLLDSIVDEYVAMGPDYVPLALEYYLVKRMAAAILSDEGGVFADVHAIVSGVVDADRLDFVRRDGISSGLGAQPIQYSRIVGDMRLFRTDGSRYAFAFPTKASDSIAALVRSRYQNYDTVVWHHSVVKSEALLTQVILRLGDESLGMEPLGDERTTLPQDMRGLWLPFVRSEDDDAATNVRTFGQWNDAWLVTTLSGAYAELSYKAEAGRLGDGEDLLLAQLAELLHGERHYLSLIKRFGDIAPVTRKFAEALKGRSDFDVDAAVGVLSRYAQARRSGRQPVTDPRSFEAAASADAFLSFLPPYGRDGQSDISGNPLVLAKYNFDALSIGGDGPSTYRELIEGLVGDFFFRDVIAESSAKDYQVVFRSLDAGTNGAVWLYTPQGVLVDLESESNVAVSIAQEERARPPFYVFAYYEGTSGWGAGDEAGLRRRFTDHLAERMAEWYVRRYEEFVRAAEC